ncbi:MAG: hypothetical protein K1X88_35495 [Nannocystaceae bacterium]|nr:hypothetical protein [Nannocystaceae bacterium]
MRRRTFVLSTLAACATRPREDEPPAVGSGAPPRTAAGPAAPAPRRSEVPRWSPAELDAHAEALRRELGDRGLTVLTEAPFVVVGDESPERVRAHARGTVRWAVERLRAQYFARDPEAIIEVWLLGSDASYTAWARERFGGTPTTPYGYYTHEHQALVMNIGTGGGTLVHEIVHPFMAANFPACPSWFDEGLASLYEQSTEHAAPCDDDACAGAPGLIWGLPNWRLPGLQAAITADHVPSTEALTRTGDRPFYDDDPGTNYAQARYLCLWLQEQGLLSRYYHAFVRAAAEDPGGFATLRTVLGRHGRDMDAFDRAWRAWVLTLSQGG